MRVIVIGLGEAGQRIARTLSRERRDVTVAGAAGVEAMPGELDALLIAGDGRVPIRAGDERLRGGDRPVLFNVSQGVAKLRQSFDVAA